ncbi:MAG: hypothetical protein NC342_06795 [Pseudoflavonifractor sp.]|nr:hypothetical protein [Alloprevotella sp.]MCM1117225.1 hypothetical protein [Pseudoflavonifractor sp.]
MTLLKNLLNKLDSVSSSADRPPVLTCKTLADKDALAQWIVANFLKNGSATLSSVLERQADVRFCSLICRHLAQAVFSSLGPDLFDRIKNEAEAMGYRLAVQRSGRLADTRSNASMVTPAKYKGYGATLNNPTQRGHLFQVNMLSFVDDKPIIGVLEAPQRDTLYVVKGAREVGARGPWRLFELDRALSDDMTALMIKPEREDVRVEFACFDSLDDINYKIIYRINTAR